MPPQYNLQQQSLVLMALITFSAINPNRCLAFQSASFIVARARAPHRAPSVHLLRASVPSGRNHSLRRRRPECFSSLSATHTNLPPSTPSSNSFIDINVQIYPEQQYILCYDGRSSRRGVSGSGAVLYDKNGIEIWSSSQHYVRETSIYEASYRGLIYGLQHAKNLGLKHLSITGCNELLHKQIEGVNQVKKPSLKEYYLEVMSLKQEFTSFHLKYVDKTKNERAWQLAQMSIAIDQDATIAQVGVETKLTVEDDEINFIEIDLDHISESMGRVNPDKVYILRFDGASRGANSGGAGAGIVLYDIDGDELWSGCQYLGEKYTKNEAEYIGLIVGMRVARILGVEHIIVQGDGPLIMRQIEGTNKVNSAKLKPFYDRATSLRLEFVSFHTSQIKRTQNARADELASEAMNTQGSSFEVHPSVTTATSTPVNGETDIDEFEQYIAGSLEDNDEDNNVNTPSKSSIPEDMNRYGKTLDPQTTYVLYFDGGSRGNPGRAGAGMVLYDSEGGTEIWSGYHYIGETFTNNEAEYTALITGLRIAKSMGVENILVQGDSQLILRQIDGMYKVKSEKLKSYYDEAISLRREFVSFRTNHIERAQNARADALANEAMDTRASTIQIDQMHKPTARKVGRSTSRDDNAVTELDIVSVPDDTADTVKNTGAAPKSKLVSQLDLGKTYVLYFDGGSRGNPGIAGVGMVLYDDESEIWSGCQYIGEVSTNNEAEYKALIAGLRIARSMGITNILVQGDSELILRQIDGVYRVKSEKLRPYFEEAMSLRREFASFRTNHIERAQNARADALANEAMDTKSSRGVD